MKNQLQIRNFFSALLLLSAPVLMAQWQDGLWVGKQANNFIDSGIRTNFNSGNAVPTFGYPMYALEGSTTLSDSAGELLFFAGNNMIWNKNSAVMLNGTGLIGGDTSSTQFGVFVPRPGSSTIFYLFNVSTSPSTTYPNPGLVYSEIDLTLDSGLGGVTANKNIVLDAAVGAEKITAVYHSDGESIWVICHRIGSNESVAYLVTAAGVSATPVVSAVGNLIPDVDPNDGSIVGYWGGGGQMKVSPDGSKLAATTLQGPNKGVSVFDFDNTTGTLSNFMHLTGYVGWPYGLEFSPNSRFLYTANPNGGYSNGGTVEQYDVSLPTDQIAASKEVIYTVTSPWAGNGGMVLGANGRIYIKDVGGETTNVIKNPNNAGLASGYQAGALPMSYGIGMPTFNQTYLESGILHELGCPGGDVTFSLLRIPDVTSVAWDFGDPASGAANTSAIAAHTFSAGGTYTVTAQITSNGGVQSASITITVPDAGAVAVAPANLTLCGSGSGIFDLTAQTATIISLLGTDYTVTYYTTETDAQDGIAAITTPATFTSSGQTIWARASNADNTCFSVVSFTLLITAPPVANPVAALSECGTTAQPNTAVFDLTPQTALLTGSQTSITVTYYPTQTDADNGTNAITAPGTYTNTANPQTVYATLENTAGCIVTTSFALNVLPTPAVAALPNLSLCDDAIANGFTPFNLAQQDALLLAGQPGVAVAYYTSQADAEAGINSITSPAAFTNTVNPQTIYVGVTNASGCGNYTSFQVNVLALPVVTTAPSLSICDTDNNGAAVFNLTPQTAILTGSQTGITVTYYPTQNDADNGTNAITTPATYTNTTSPQTIFATLENAAGCISSTSFTLNALPVPTVVTLPNLSLCDDATADGFTGFNLAQQDALLQASQPGVAVAYYRSQADAEAGTNVISSPAAFTNTVNPQTIYVGVTNAAGCSNYTSFQVNVLALPLAPQAPDLSVCDTDNNGISEFNLTVQDAVYQTGQPGVTVTYFTTTADAAANTNAIATPASFANTQNAQIVYTRIDNGTCYAISTFTLQVNDAPVFTSALTVTGCSPYDLTEIETGLDAGLDASYYTTQANAEDAINAVTDPANYVTENIAVPVYVRAENAEGCYTVAELSITRGDCFIQRGISPGGSEGQNDTFDLSNLDVTKLSIFNRYGQEVFTYNGNYTNQWGGQTDSGQDLPTGTYFYMFQRNTGESKTGWIYINRQN
jgi:gliding motility-associated-like protein